MAWKDGDTRPRTVEEVRAYVFEQSSKDNRRALLNVHTRRTLEAASRALNNRWKWAGRYDAARILIAAAPKYVRLGGDLNPWRDLPRHSQMRRLFPDLFREGQS